MPTIVFISPFIWEGGPHKGKATVYYIMRGFVRAGYSVHVVSATNEPGPLNVELDELHIHYFRIPINPVTFQYSALRSYLSLIRVEPNRLVRHLKFRLFWLQFVFLGFFKTLLLGHRIRPKLLYGINNPGIPIASSVGWILGIPNFSRIMGSPLGEWARDHISYSSAKDGSIQSHSRGLFRLWLARFDELLAFRLPSSAVIVTDDATISRHLITDWLGVPDINVWLLRNGIDKQLFQSGLDQRAARDALGIPINAQVVLWVSQLVDWKHTERLIEAIPEIVSDCPSAYFLIVGGGPERPYLEQRVQTLKASAVTRFTGFVRRDQIPIYYRAADVFAAFYDYANVSNTLLEAMLSGNAVITLDNGHTSEVVRHLQNGYLVDPSNIQEIPSAIVRLLTDDPFRQQLQSAAMVYSDKEFLTWDERIDREIIRIESILDKENKKP